MSGEYGGGYSKADAAADTNCSTSQVSAAWHDARDAAADEGGWGVPADRHGDSGSKNHSSNESSSGNSGK